MRAEANDLSDEAPRWRFAGFALVSPATVLGALRFCLMREAAVLDTTDGDGARFFAMLRSGMSEKCSAPTTGQKWLQGQIWLCICIYVYSIW